MRILISLFASAIAVFGCGCTVLTSETSDILASQNRAPRGVQYSLPKGTIVAKLSVDAASASFILTLEPGELIPDSEEEFVLRYRANAFYEDEISIRTNDKGLLTSVETTTEDKTPAIIVNVAKAISALGGLEADALPKQIVQIYERSFDPFDDAERRAVTSDVDKQVAAYVQTTLEACAHLSDDVPAAFKRQGNAAKTAETILEDQQGEQSTEVETLRKDKSLIDAAVAASLKSVTPKDLGAYQAETESFNFCEKRTDPIKDICDRLQQQDKITNDFTKAQQALTKTEAALEDLKAKRKAQSPQCQGMAALTKLKLPLARIELDEQNSWTPTTDLTDIAAVDCSVGICYRPVEPIKLRYSLGAGDETLIVDMPNKDHVVAVDIRRAFFVKKIQKMTFDRGLLTKLEIDKKSELVAISKLPVDVIGAIGEGLKFRVAVKTEQKNVLQREADLLKAQTTLSDARAAQGASRALESAPLIAGRPPRGAASPSVQP